VESKSHISWSHLVSGGIRFCEAIGLQVADFDFEAAILEVARSVVKVSRQHHPRGKTFLVRARARRNRRISRQAVRRAAAAAVTIRGPSQMSV
jgi:integrase